MTANECHIELSHDEHDLLARMLEQALNDCRREEHRSETFAYRKFLQQRESLMEGLIARLRQWCAGTSERDEVQVASEGSFPASDPPSWTPVQSAGTPRRGNTADKASPSARAAAPRQPAP